ncbi:MAG: carboxymuconolactone decarboxylase family protein [Betaproteobacteria bacterium]
MASPLVDVSWDQCLLEPAPDRKAEAAVRRDAGAAPGWIRYFLGCPWLPKAAVRLGIDNKMLVHLEFPTADLIALVVSQEHSCRYCYAITRMQLRILGMSEERMQQLEQRLASGELEPRAAAAVRFARRMSRSAPLATPQDLEPLREAGYSDAEIREIAYVVASNAFLNRVVTIPALPPQTWEQLADRWFMRLFRPLVALRVRGLRKRGQPALFARPPEGPFAGLLLQFEGSPIGPALASALDDLWASPILSRHCKALMFAVIGHGLGSQSSRDEIARVLEAEGLPPAEAEKILAHLGGPGVDDGESALLAFARDTIWYEPIKIQRRARELRERLSVAQFVEALGVAALANSLCRLCAVLPRRP